MITRDQYFRDPRTGSTKPHQPEHDDAAKDLLGKVNRLLDHAVSVIAFQRSIDPDTGSEISGKAGGAGDGGFRLPDSKTGAAHSKHRTGHGIDVYDPGNYLDTRLTDGMLEEFGLYREHPDSTSGWCHLQDLPPHSKRRTYYP